jgi:hypothetical protein
MATTKTHYAGKWDTFHNNGPFNTKIIFETRLESKDNMPSHVDRYNDGAKEVQRLIKDSVANNERFRAYGSAWSLSSIAHQKDRMHFNGAMNLKVPLTQNDLHPSTQYRPGYLFFFECGNTIKECSEHVHKNGRSLKASGASNGQTIAGAISTGIHGAALDFGSVQDFVVGLNIIIGPNANDIVYIERKSRPALSDSFAQSIKSRVIRNDGLFNAALVSLGAFGFIHGVVIDTEDRYLLRRYTKRIKSEQALKIAETLDFENSDFKIPSEVDVHGKGFRPYHFKVYINPYNAAEDWVTEIIYKKPYRQQYPDPIPTIRTAIYKDLPTWIAIFAAKHKRLIPTIINAMKGTIFPTLDTDIEGTIGEIFWDSTHKGPAFAVTMGIDHSQTRKALKSFLKLVNEEGPIPGAVALRFVKASEATLAFTRFPVTCILEMDGVLWEGNQNMISLAQFTRRIVEVFIADGIKFTLHWGKNAAWDFPGLIDYMYGNKDDEWKMYRSALLSKQMADMFSNEFLQTAGLADYRVNTPPTLIA